MHETERRLVGRVAALYRYPVKSMRGEALDEARLARGFAEAAAARERWEQERKQEARDRA